MKIGVDLGGTNTVVGICSDAGKLLCKRSLPTATGKPEQVCANMKQLALAVCQEVGAAPDTVCQIGIGVPGTFDKEKCMLNFGTNLGMNEVCFASIFAPEFSCPVWIDNDANCAALGEFIGGAGQNSNSMVMLTLGTGVGGGMVLNGKLYTGENHIAGEIGHMVIQYGGLPCNCGKRGCLETYASATGLIHMAEQAMQRQAGTKMQEMKRQNGGKMTAKMVCDARDAGDAAADAVFTQYVQYLACGINNVIAILQPQKIVLGGGVSGYGEKLLLPLRAQVEKDLMQAACKQSEVVLATLGNDAGIIGAAMLEC